MMKGKKGVRKMRKFDVEGEEGGQDGCEEENK
jgi:hypothetical protein